MPLFSPLEPDRHAAIAATIVQHGLDTFAGVVARYRSGYELLWGQSDFTVADAQLVLDKLGPNAVAAFQASYALGQLINALSPGTLSDAELSAPVGYTIHEDGTITLDPDGTYPATLSA